MRYNRFPETAKNNPRYAEATAQFRDIAVRKIMFVEFIDKKKTTRM